MTQKRSGIGRVFAAFWHMINFTRKAILNVLFFSVLLVLFIGLSADDDTIKVPPSTALVLDISGNLVEQKRAIDPVDEFLTEASSSNDKPQEVLLSNIVAVLENSAADNRIKAVVLRLQNLSSANTNKLDIIGKALQKVKDANKPIYAIGDIYTQDQYYLASYADHIMLDPMGAIFFNGYGAYPTYFKSALDKLKISTHIFRVGTYKSAVEPFMRDNMSEAAKQANQQWVDELWENYKTQVAERRHIPVSTFDDDISVFIEKFEAVNADYGQYALTNKWVDELADRHQYRKVIADVVGWNDDDTSFNQINYNTYLKLIKPHLQFKQHKPEQVAVIYAKGTILDGHQKAGDIGGDSTANLLQKARLNDKVKAIVLRVDSPGGSAFASEVIRKEILKIKDAGKPIVTSMSSVAASGGYWIAASTDKIIASPTTITGSIGIFGMFMTFENTLDYLGVHTDGVGSTDWAGFGVSTQLDSRISHIIQRSIENGYERFLNLVASNRNMSREQVDTVAQGRVWTGTQAKELGLVDELGDLDLAIETVAELAELTDYSVITVEQELSKHEQLIKEILGSTSSLLNINQSTSSDTDKLQQLIRVISKEYNAIAQLNDPKGVYLMCLACPE